MSCLDFRTQEPPPLGLGITGPPTLPRRLQFQLLNVPGSVGARGLTQKDTLPSPLNAFFFFF